MTLDDVKDRLRQVSDEMTGLIRKYGLSAQSSLQVIEEARTKIADPQDYVRFLELSLEGRILADEGERLMKAQAMFKQGQTLQ